MSEVDRANVDQTRGPVGGLPNALGAWGEIERQVTGKRIALFLDYDGTLTPIVDDPAKARLWPPMRTALAAAASAWPTAIVSGRRRSQLEQLVALPGLVYAGSHGFDVRGPGGLQLEVAPEAVPVLASAAEELRRRTAGVHGAQIEEKGFSVALHHRRAPRAAIPELERAIDTVLASRPELIRTEGKRVFELRPAVAWDKGRVVRWLVERMGSEGAEVVPVYVGDDGTDEDAFRAVSGTGIGIRVGNDDAWSSATYALADVAEVEHLLLRMAALGGRMRPTERSAEER